MSVVYNPGLLKPEALIRSFVARLDLLEELVEELRHDRPGHRLLVGQRGMGKTTLLRRVAVEVARDPSRSAGCRSPSPRSSTTCRRCPTSG